MMNKELGVSTRIAETTASAPGWNCKQQQQQQQTRSGAAGDCSRLPPAAAAMPRRLLFLPCAVKRSFQQHYSTTTLGLCDSICLPLDVLTWACCLLMGSWRTQLGLLCTLPALSCAVACAVLRAARPGTYRQHRMAITALRHLAVLPHLSLVLLPRPLHAASSWQAACLHTLVLSGGVHTLIATFFFLDFWWSALAELLGAAAVLASAAPAACSNVLAGPWPHAGSRSAAALMDRAALGIYSSSLRQPQLEHAVCCATLNTVLMTCTCLAAYLVHWFEHQQRLRYKAQLPHAVAALQGHLYPLPAGLAVAQALLLLIHPAIVMGWITFGSWHGLMAAAVAAPAVPRPC